MVCDYGDSISKENRRSGELERFCCVDEVSKVWQYKGNEVSKVWQYKGNLIE